MNCQILAKKIIFQRIIRRIMGKKYLGIGPSAHSYDGVSRSWNVSNNVLYLKSIQENKLPNEIEILSITDRI
jgi:oxygen-independent coproporphyrinogen-3 oxidase